MEPISSIDRTADGRLVLTGAAMLPPMETTQPAPKQTRTKDRTNKLSRDRFGVLNAFVDCSLAGLSRIEIATWLCLYRDTRNGTACTSQGDIARRVGGSVRGVQKAITKLRKRGLLIVVFVGGMNRGPSRYRVESQTNRSSS
jgi:hypothetical protein